MPAHVLDELDLLVRSRRPRIVLDTVEDDRADELPRHLGACLGDHVVASHLCGVPRGRPETCGFREPAGTARTRAPGPPRAR